MDRQIPELLERQGMVISKRPIIIMVATGQTFVVLDTMSTVTERLSTVKFLPEEKRWVEFTAPSGDRVALAPWIVDKIVGIYEMPQRPCKLCNGTGVQPQ